MKTKKKLLLTGASGFTGLHASLHFTELGWDVLGITRSPYSHPLMKCEICDLADSKQLESIIADFKPEYCLHLAAINSVPVSWKSPQLSIESNVMGTLHLFEGLRKFAPSCKVVVAGSILEHDFQSQALPPHPYSLSKSLQTMLSMSWSAFYNMNIAVAKPCNLIGPGPSTGICSLFVKKAIEIEKVSAENKVDLRNPSSSREFLDVRDAVRAYEILLENGEKGKVYEIGSGNRVTLGDVLNECQKHTSIPLNVVIAHGSAEDHYHTEDLRPIKDLGWKPRISFSQSITDLFYYFRMSQL